MTSKQSFFSNFLWPSLNNCSLNKTHNRLISCSFLDAAAKSGLTSHKYLWLVTQSVVGDPVDVPASIRRSLPLGMIGKVFIYLLIPTQNFKDLCIISHTLLKMHQTQKVRVHLGILCVLRTYLLSYLTLTERSHYPEISLGLAR